MNHPKVFFGLSVLMCVSAMSAQTLEEAVNLFMRSPKCSRFELSPDGSHVAMIYHEKNTNYIATFDLMTRQQRAAKGVSGQNIRSYHWVDGDNILLSADIWNIYYQGMYATDQDLRHYRLLGEPYFVDQFGINFSRDALYVLDPLPSVPNLALLRDATDNKRFASTVYYDFSRNSLIRREKNRDKIVGHWCDNSGVIRVIRKLGKPGKSNLFYRSGEDASWESLDLPRNPHIKAYDSAQNNLFIDYMEGDGRRTFQIFNINKQELIGKPVSHPQFACSPRVLRDKQSGAIIGLQYELDKPKIFYFDKGYREAQQALQELAPNSVVRVLGSTVTGSLLFDVTSDILPQTVFELSSTGDVKLNRLISRFPWIKREDCQKMEPIKFEARDEETIHGYLTRSRSNPDTAGPTVMLIHGGPKVRDSWGFNSLVQFIAYLGYNVIQVNYRGSSGFNRGYSIGKYTRICTASFEDVADAARWAIEQGIADPDRIAIMGGSFGGYAALAGAAFEPDLYKVAIGYAGVYHFDRQLKEYYRDDNEVRTWLTPMIGAIEKSPDLYQELSPVNYADQIKAKVLLLHGGADNIVSSKQSKLMGKALKEAGVEHEMHISSWGVHGFYNETSRKKFGTRVGQFLLDNL